MPSPLNPFESQLRHHLEDRLLTQLHDPPPGLQMDPQRVIETFRNWSMEWGKPLPPFIWRVVQPEGRPAVVIQHGKFSVPASNVWQPNLGMAQSLIENAIPSVGQIEKIDDSTHETMVVGTGWMVEERVMITNRHVAISFARKVEAGYEFRRGNDFVTPLRVTIDFQREHEVAGGQVFSVEEILDIAPDDGPDLAFLRIGSSIGEQIPPPTPITLATEPERLTSGTQVVTIGYPGRPLPGELAPGEETVNEAVFQAYGVKTLSPGQITGANLAGIFVHDCSTLEGSSGSVIIHLETGKALGIHYHGSFMVGNEAVSFVTIRKYLSSLGF